MKSAVKFGIPELIDDILAIDSNTKHQNRLGRTPLIVAAWKNCPNVAKRLIEKGANVEAVDLEERTALAYAALKNSIEVATVLIDAKADIECKDKYGFSPLSIAIFKNKTEMFNKINRMRC